MTKRQQQLEALDAVLGYVENSTADPPTANEIALAREFYEHAKGVYEKQRAAGKNFGVTRKYATQSERQQAYRERQREETRK